MKFEKLEKRCVLDGAGFCTPMENSTPVTPVQIEYDVYGPVMPADVLAAEQATVVGTDNFIQTPLSQVEYNGPEIEVPELIINGVLVSKQDVLSSTGLRAALDILEASGGYIAEWLNGGITQVYKAGDKYYFEFETPLDHVLTLGQRSLSVDISDGTVYGSAMW